VETVSARNVVDGAALARRWQQRRDAHTGPSNSRPSVNTVFVDDDPIATKHDADLAVELDGVLDSLDAVGDVLLTEGVYHTVQGNYERGGAALEAASGNAPPPEIGSMETPTRNPLVRGVLPNPESRPGSPSSSVRWRRLAAPPSTIRWKP
jgi:hypothetical protein